MYESKQVLLGKKSCLNVSTNKVEANYHALIYQIIKE